LDANAYAGICPDFMLNQPYYNQIFNGNKFKIKEVETNLLGHSGKDERIYAVNDTVQQTTSSANYPPVYVCSVTEDVPTVAIQDKTYKLNIGVAEEAYRFGHAGNDSSGGDETNIVRGIYSPYLAIYSNTKLKSGALYNIYSNNQQSIE